MSRRKIKAGSTSQSEPIFVQDTSSATGAGLDSLVYNSSGLAARYRRQGANAWTSITLATMTLGTWTSGGFIASSGVTGSYEVGMPDAALASAVGVTWVEFEVYGATNMLPVKWIIELDAIDYQASGGKVPATIASGDFADISATRAAYIDLINSRLLGTILAGNHNPQTGDSYARLGAPTGASVAADIATVAGYVDTEVAAILAAVDTEVAAIYAKVANLSFISGLVRATLY